MAKLESAYKIIRQDGACKGISCSDCFLYENGSCLAVEFSKKRREFILGLISTLQETDYKSIITLHNSLNDEHDSLKGLLAKRYVKEKTNA